MSTPRRPRPFDRPVHVSRPGLPPLDAYADTLRAAWDSRILTNDGPLVRRLETELAQRLKLAHLSVVSSGTTALLLACRALDLRGEVITTPFTFAATANVLPWCGATPVFADIDPVTLTLDPVAAERAVTARTTGILAVHVFGAPCDLSGLQRLADRHRLKLLYDGAHVFETRIDGRSLLEFGDATALSFHATKRFHTVEGGAVVSRDAELMRRVNRLRTFGAADDGAVVEPGLNGKLSELHAAMGLAGLPLLDARSDARAKVAAVYRERLAGLPGVSVAAPSALEAPQFCALRIGADAPVPRDAVLAQLQEFNVFARRYFTPLCSAFPQFSALPSSAKENLPVAHRVAAEILCLPIYDDLGEDAAGRIADIVRFVVCGQAER